MTPTASWRFSFHGGHSGEFCCHASGTLAEVVEAAIAAGMSRLGITEHAPRYRAADLYPDEVEAGIGVDDLATRFAAYAGRVDEIRSRLGDRIAIVKGMETEVVPPADWAERMTELRATHGIEYVVGSVHHVHGIAIDVDRATWDRAAEAAGGARQLFLDYYALQGEMLRTLRPEVVGHFDYIKLLAPHRPAVEEAEDANLRQIARIGALLEVNGKAFRKGLGEPYPSLAILRRARALGVRATLGDDSHGPDDVGRSLDLCREALLEAGYETVHALVPDGAGGLIRTPVPLDEEAA